MLVTCNCRSEWASERVSFRIEWRRLSRRLVVQLHPLTPFPYSLLYSAVNHMKLFQQYMCVLQLRILGKKKIINEELFSRFNSNRRVHSEVTWVLKNKKAYFLPFFSTYWMNYFIRTFDIWENNGLTKFYKIFMKKYCKLSRWELVFGDPLKEVFLRWPG